MKNTGLPSSEAIAAPAAPPTAAPPTAAAAPAPARLLLACGAGESGPPVYESQGCLSDYLYTQDCAGQNSPF